MCAEERLVWECKELWVTGHRLTPVSDRSSGSGTGSARRLKARAHQRRGTNVDSSRAAPSRSMRWQISRSRLRTASGFVVRHRCRPRAAPCRRRPVHCRKNRTRGRLRSDVRSALMRTSGDGAPTMPRDSSSSAASSRMSLTMLASNRCVSVLISSAEGSSPQRGPCSIQIHATVLSLASQSRRTPFAPQTRAPSTYDLCTQVAG